MPTSSPSLTDLWPRGVAANTAAPADVLLRLLDPAAGEARRILCEERRPPDEVMDAIVVHPEWRVRRSLAGNPHIRPAQRGRLVEDPHDLVRATVAAGPRPRTRPPQPLPDDVVVTLLTAREPAEPGLLTAGQIVSELLSSWQVTASFRYRMRGHEHPAVRYLAMDVWGLLTPEEQEALLGDPDPDVRSAAARRRAGNLAAGTEDLPEHGRVRWQILHNDPLSDAAVAAAMADPESRWCIAGNRHTPADAVARLARDADPGVRLRVAARAGLDQAVWAELARDPHEQVRTRARVQPLPRTAEQCRAVDHEMDEGDHDCTCTFLESCTEPDLDWYRACAESGEVVLRLVAATFPALPADLVARLAQDPHEEVRHRLAVRHPLAPAATVLAAFVARPRQRAHLLMQSRLPRTGLSHLLDHEDPEVRMLAAADPTLRQAPAELLADPDDRVRRAAAANPLFAGETLEALLHDPVTAEGAAANPSLPAARLHALLDRADLPRLTR
ncbi:hypothetical protein [Streptomyces sp. NPDC054987]